MAIEQVQFGPFVGGLNLSSDASTIADNELAYLVNLELENDGALRVRPLDFPSNIPEIPGDSGSKLRVLGYYNPLGVAAPILIATNGVNTYSINWRDEDPDWVQIASYPASDCAQFRDRLYLLVPLGNGATGVYLSGFNTGTSEFATSTNQTDMPKGSRIIAFKDRLWVIHGKSATSNGARLYVSDFSTGAAVIWSNDFVNINLGDGQNIVDIQPYSQDIVIFKEDSTFRFTYSNTPADGAVTLVSDAVGVENVNCITAYENSFFVAYGTDVYEFANYQFEPVSAKISAALPEFFSESLATLLTDPIALSVWDDRLIFTYYGETFVMSLVTRTWSQWQLDRYGVIAWPITVSNSKIPEAFLSGYRRSDFDYRNLLQIRAYTGREEHPEDDAALNTFYCGLVTKKHSYNNPTVFKRLVSWGIDGSVAAWQDEPSIAGTLSPTTAASPMSWAELSFFTWEEISSYPWATPGVKNFDVTTHVNVPATTEGSYVRKFIRFPKAGLRFREIDYDISFASAPMVAARQARIYSLITRVASKAKTRFPVN